MNDANGMALFCRTVTLTASYVAVQVGYLFWGEILAPTNNAGAAYMLGDDGSDSQIPVGVAMRLEGVDLGALKLKGTAGDLVCLEGQYAVKR